MICAAAFFVQNKAIVKTNRSNIQPTLPRVPKTE